MFRKASRKCRYPILQLRLGGQHIDLVQYQIVVKLSEARETVPTRMNRQT